jgi:hypothetical protein
VFYSITRSARFCAPLCERDFVSGELQSPLR